MNLKVYLAAGALVLCSYVAKAADQPQKKEMPPDQKAAMEAMMKAASPGDAHKKLASFVGKWDATVKTWMQPGAPPMENKGTATNEAILGGRFIEQRFSGDFMGQPFSGLGYWGYDNVRQQYIASWMDSMGTSMMTLTGTGSGNQYTLKGTVPDPMTGKDSLVEERWTVADNDHHMFEMWAPAPDGAMFKMMEISYTRKK